MDARSWRRPGRIGSTKTLPISSSISMRWECAAQCEAQRERLSFGQELKCGEQSFVATSHCRFLTPAFDYSYRSDLQSGRRSLRDAGGPGASSEENTMPQRITPFLWFDDNAEEAANFYISVFPNSEVTEVSHYGEAGPGVPGSVLVVSFRLDGQAFSALNGGPEFTFNEAVSFVIDCQSQEEVDYYWDTLTRDGEPSQCGWLKDKFGVS